jgi:L-seryl-tRNA(Ser) seleniumtransferase
MIAASEEAIHERAVAMRDVLHATGIEATIARVEATVGGGSLPGETMPSRALALEANDGGIDDLARRLRLGQPGVFGRIEHDRLLLDLRTILAEDDQVLAGAVRQAMA